MNADRLGRLHDVMTERRIELVLISPSADMRYFAGFPGHVSERPVILAITPEGPPWMLVPILEAPTVPEPEDLRMLAYEETEDPILRLFDVLRPGPGTRVAISDSAWAGVLLRLQAAFTGSIFIPASPLIRELRMVKSAEELENLRRAGALADAAFAELVQQHFAGRTEREIGEALNQLMREQGLDVSDHLPIVGSGPNAASPHHNTGEREIQEGDAVVLDFGGTVEGYPADITRTVHVGTPQREFVHVYDVVRQAQEAGVQAVRPGAEAQSVDAVTRDVIRAAGYGDFFIHRTGHGIGLEIHEDPYIVAGNTLPLEAGMTFSVEPGVYLAGRFGVRIEDIIAVTDDGVERFNHATRELVIVG